MQLTTLSARHLSRNATRWVFRDKAVDSDLRVRSSQGFKAKGESKGDPLKRGLLAGSMVIEFRDGGKVRHVRLAPLHSTGPVAVRVRPSK